MQDRRLLRKVCEMVSTRAARLAAAGVAAVVVKMGRVERCAVAVDGSVFQHYPNFESRMQVALDELFGGSAAHGIRFVRSEDGSGRGAALVVASARAAVRAVASA